MYRMLLALSVPAVLLVAQGAPAPERTRPDLADPAVRARIFARLHAIRTERLQTSLGVTPVLAKSIADRWGQFDQDSHGRRQSMRETRQKVQDILVGPGSEEDKNARIGPAMAQFSALQKAQRDAKEKFEADIQRLLTPAQQGRFLVLMDEFQRRLGEVVREHRER